jgi:adenylate cyclase
MALKDIIAEIDRDIADMAGTKFEYVNTKYVPSANDPGLSYERGVSKKGKIIKTCVLYVDIRDSVALTAKHQSITMGRIYTSFTKAVIKIARHHGGHTRNIVGDRVMIVFPEDKTFTNAVECALSINYIASNIFPSKFPGVAFKCGIGIDHGELKVLKVGIQRNGVESAENKGLVWTGYPANIASRLTDMANKTITENYYSVKYYSLNLGTYFGLGSPLSKPSVPFYSTLPTKKEMSEIDFASSIRVHNDGQLFFVDGKMISFEKKTRTYKYPPILVTNSVLSGLKSESINDRLYRTGYWREQIYPIKNVSEKVFGSELSWSLK